MEPSELLAYLTRKLDELRLPYLVTGSMATIFYGEPRLTNDIDVVVELTSAVIDSFCACFSEPEYYISRDAVAEAIEYHSQFNIIHPASGLKIDVMIPDNSPFNRTRLARGRSVAVTPDLTVRFASPEDVIVKKLAYYKTGGSEKHLRDITGVLRIQREKVDRTYIERWAAELGLSDVWESVLSRVDQ